MMATVAAVSAPSKEVDSSLALGVGASVEIGDGLEALESEIATTGVEEEFATIQTESEKNVDDGSAAARQDDEQPTMSGGEAKSRMSSAFEKQHGHPAGDDELFEAAWTIVRKYRKEWSASAAGRANEEVRAAFSFVGEALPKETTDFVRATSGTPSARRPRRGWSVGPVNEAQVRKLRKQFDRGGYGVPGFDGSSWMWRPPEPAFRTKRQPPSEWYYLRPWGVWCPDILCPDDASAIPVCPNCETNLHVECQRAKWAESPTRVLGQHYWWMLDTKRYPCRKCRCTFRATNPQSMKFAPADLKAIFGVSIEEGVDRLISCPLHHRHVLHNNYRKAC